MAQTRSLRRAVDACACSLSTPDAESIDLSQEVFEVGWDFRRPELVNDRADREICTMATLQPFVESREHGLTGDDFKTAVEICPPRSEPVDCATRSYRGWLATGDAPVVSLSEVN